MALGERRWCSLPEGSRAWRQFVGLLPSWRRVPAAAHAPAVVWPSLRLSALHWTSSRLHTLAARVATLCGRSECSQAPTPPHAYLAQRPVVLASAEVLTASARQADRPVLIWDRPNTGSSDIVLLGDGMEAEMQADAVRRPRPTRTFIGSPSGVLCYRPARCPSASQLALLLQHLGLARVALFGTSNGGRMSAFFCQRYPAAAKALVLNNITAGQYAAACLAEAYYRYRPDARFLRRSTAQHASIVCDGRRPFVPLSSVRFGTCLLCDGRLPKSQADCLLSADTSRGTNSRRASGPLGLRRQYAALAERGGMAAVAEAEHYRAMCREPANRARLLAIDPGADMREEQRGCRATVL